MTKIVRPERIERAARRIAPSIPRGRSLIIDASGRRRLTRSQKVGVAGVATLAGVALLGVACQVGGRVLHRLHLCTALGGVVAFLHVMPGLSLSAAVVGAC